MEKVAKQRTIKEKEEKYKKTALFHVLFDQNIIISFDFTQISSQYQGPGAGPSNPDVDTSLVNLSSRNIFLATPLLFISLGLQYF